jgi:hypothetical protein
MRNRLIGSIVVVVAVMAFSPGMLAQTPAGPGAGKGIPDLTGLWEVRINPPGTPPTICGEPACRAAAGLALPQVFTRDAQEPPMLPRAQEQYKAFLATAADPGAAPRQALNPSWGGCMPEGPTESMRRRAFELRQFPDVVLVLFDHDHGVRRIYMDGRGHPDHPAATWMGHSIGRYEGEVLVVDTIGISDKAWIDFQGHPRTDALRVTERFQRLDQKTLEVQTTFDDPKTYQKPWTKTVIHHLRAPGPQIWDQTECEELLRLGTHYSAEAKK